MKKTRVVVRTSKSALPIQAAVRTLESLGCRVDVFQGPFVVESILHGLADELKAIRILLAAGSQKKETRRHMDRGKHVKQRFPKRKMRNLRGLQDGEWI